MSQINNARIAKNTIMLYVRMLVIMAVSLYTSRVILQELGVEDYGTYNLVAGFVTLFSFISNSLISAVQRYFNVALGANDRRRYKEIYTSSINLMLVLSLIILVLGETLGLWFVRTQLNIPVERVVAAEWVYHISLLTFVVNLLRTTFNASIIAHERMTFYAYISIFEAVARLGIVYALTSIGGDKLISYTILYCLVSVLMTIVNWVYCRGAFSECRYSIQTKDSVFKELMKFSSWTLLGQSSVVIKNQGEAILINRFFSVVANSALGIANQVTNALDMFVTNFQTAFNPQIVKTYASEEYQQHHLLVCRASKFSYYLLLVLSLPILFNVNIILQWWLGVVPAYTDSFCVFIIISHLINAHSTPFNTSILATGKIKRYQIICAIIYLLGLLLSGVCLWFDGPVYSIAIVGILVQGLLFVNRFVHVVNCTMLNPMYYFHNALKPMLFVTLCYAPVVYLTSLYANGIIGVIVMIGIDLVCAVGLIYLLGLSINEKELVKRLILRFLKK